MNRGGSFDLIHFASALHKPFAAPAPGEYHKRRRDFVRSKGEGNGAGVRRRMCRDFDPLRRSLDTAAGVAEMRLFMVRGYAGPPGSSPQEKKERRIHDIEQSA